MSEQEVYVSSQKSSRRDQLATNEGNYTYPFNGLQCISQTRQLSMTLKAAGQHRHAAVEPECELAPSC
jgi:hypothetical protein